MLAHTDPSGRAVRAPAAVEFERKKVSGRTGGRPARAAPTRTAGGFGGISGRIRAPRLLRLGGVWRFRGGGSVMSNTPALHQESRGGGEWRGAGSPTTAARASVHHNRFGPESPWHHVLHLSPHDGPTLHIDLCKSPETATSGHSQILGATVYSFK